MTINKKYLALTKDELKKRTIIEECCHKHMRQQAGADYLGIGIRQLQRLIKSYKDEGNIGIIHGLRGRKSNHHKDKEKEGQIISIMNEEIYHDFGPTFLSEIQQRDE